MTRDEELGEGMPSLRGRWGREVDGVLAGVFICSFFFHFFLSETLA